MRRLTAAGEVELTKEEIKKQDKGAVIYRDESVEKLLSNDTMRYEQNMRQVMADNMALSVLTNKHIMMKKGTRKRKQESD